MEIKNETMPTRQVKFNKHKHKNSQWITQGIIRSIAYKDKLYITLKKTPTNNPDYDAIKLNLHTYTKLLKSNIRQAKQIYYNNCFLKYKQDIRNTWATIKEIMGKKSKPKKYPDSFTYKDKFVTKKQDIANSFNNFFISLGLTLASKIKKTNIKSFTDYLCDKHEHILNFKTVSGANVSKIISEMKSKNSSSHDEISSKMLKTISNSLAKPLTLLINQCLYIVISPDNMKLAKAIPIHKKGDISDMTNYRLISLLPSISKIIEKVAYNQLSNYLLEHNLIYKHQYGFRPNHSTELAALHTIDKMITDLDLGLIPLNIFLDLSKVFDTFDHNILIHKLQYNGILNTELNFFKNYLQNREQFVQLDHIKSTSQKTLTGVPQGSILGPLLFIIYINDIKHTSKYFKILTYADDTTLMCTLNKKELKNIGELTKKINLELDKIMEWLQLNKLSLNIAKSKFMIFHMAQYQVHPPTLKINNIQIEHITFFNFLGIILHENLKWEEHVNHVSNKISKVIGTISKLKQYIPSDVLLTLYNSLILPHLYYGITLWGYNNLDRILRIQKKAVRIIANSTYYAHSEPLFKMLDILKIQDIHTLQQFKFIYKLLHDNLPHYFNSITVTHNRDIHQYNTRQRNNVLVPNIQHEFARKCKRNQIYVFLNNSPKTIVDKINTHSLKGFSTYIKKYLIDGYKLLCTVYNFYTCNRP